ncbi:MAG: winged helix-turn-helix domain-containing protein [Lysobacteraceae bacterium]
MSSEGSGQWRFGQVCLDERLARVTVGSTAVDLDRSSYLILHELVRRAGELVDKETLIKIGWPGRVVSDNSLAKAISRLRQCLGEDGAAIRVVHGYGYKFIANVTLNSGSSRAPSEITEHSDLLPRASSMQRRAWLAGIAVVLLLGLAWVGWQASHGRSKSKPTPSQREASIAVLPFVVLSQNHDQQYLADGFADELLDQLAQSKPLKVASRTSSFVYRQHPEDIKVIGRALGVATVLEGSLRRSGDRLRVTVQLIDTSDGFHLWSQTYDRSVTDLFSVQDDITRAVVTALKVTLLAPIPHQHLSDNAQAYEQYLLGTSLRRGGTADDQRRAIAPFENAIRLDPGFADAYVELADVLGGDALYADTPEQIAAGKQRSLQLMDQAIVLAPNRPDLYVRRADFRYYTAWDFAGGQRDLDIAAKLYRNNDYHQVQNQCRLLMILDRIPEAIAIEERYVAEFPMSDAWNLLGYHYAILGRRDDARRALEHDIAINPTDNHAHWYFGLNYLWAGEPAKALEEFDSSGDGFRFAGMAMAYHDLHETTKSQQALDLLIGKYATSYAYQIATVYAWRGEKDVAFEWLDRALARRDASLVYLKFDPLMKTLRGDQRYHGWLKRMRLDG